MDSIVGFIEDYLFDEYDNVTGTATNEILNKIRLLLKEWKPSKESIELIKNDYMFSLIDKVYEIIHVDDLFSDYLNKNVLSHFWSAIIENDDTNYISRLYNYLIQGEYFYVDEIERKEMNAKAIIYRACSKAIWNPRCELGKRMIMNRLNKDGLSNIIE
tara:strand:- start:342 stop:818 length:477 start_codon:yes stop_codon:yes gene_type:complete